MNLREAAQQALEILEEIHPGNMTPLAEGAWSTAITALRAALAEGAMQRLTDVQQEMERKPLTDEEIDRVWRSVDYKISYDNFRLAIARAIERAHGIGGEE